MSWVLLELFAMSCLGVEVVPSRKGGKRLLHGLCVPPEEGKQAVPPCLQPGNPWPCCRRVTDATQIAHPFPNCCLLLPTAQTCE